MKNGAFLRRNCSGTGKDDDDEIDPFKLNGTMVRCDVRVTCVQSIYIKFTGNSSVREHFYATLESYTKKAENPFYLGVCLLVRV